MSTPEVRITQTTDDAQILASFQRQQAAIIKLLSKFTELKNKGNEAGNAMAGSINTAVANFKQLVVALTGIGSVIGAIMAAAAQVRREIENIRAMQQKGADANISFEAAMEGAIRNAGGLMDQKDIRRNAMKIAENARTSPTKVAAVISESFTAAGSTTPEQAAAVMPGVEAAAKFAPSADAQTMAQISASAIDLNKRTGKTPEESIGFIAKAQTLARVTQLEDMVKNVMPAVNSMILKREDLGMQPGARESTAAALVATITQASTDVTGRRSGTAAIQLQKQLEERFPGKTIEEALGTLERDPEELEKFIKGGSFTMDGQTVSMKAGEMKFPKASFEAKTIMGVRSTITPGTPENRQFKEYIRALEDDRANLKLYNDIVAQVQASSPVSQTERLMKSGTEVNRLNDPKAAITGVLRKELPEYLQSLGESDLKQRIETLKMDFSGGLSGEGDPIIRAAEMLEKTAGQRRKNTGPELARFLGFAPGSMGVQAPTYEAMETAKSLDEQAARLRQMREEMQKNNPEIFAPPTQEQRDEVYRFQPPAGQPATPPGQPVSQAVPQREAIGNVAAPEIPSGEQAVSLRRDTLPMTDDLRLPPPAERAGQHDADTMAVSAANGPDLARLADSLNSLIDHLKRTGPPSVNVNVAGTDSAGPGYRPRTIRPNRSALLDRRNIG